MDRPPFSTRLTLLLVSSLTVMSGATISPALPAMAEHFAAVGVADAGFWSRVVLTAPAIGIALTASAAGALGDRLGRVRLMMAAAVLYAAAGSAGLWTGGVAALVASRVALGLAVAVLMTGATALIGDSFHGRARDAFMGLQASFMGFGGVVYLTAGGALAEAHWRAPFALYLASLPLLALMAATLRERPPSGAGAAAAGPTAAAPRVPPGVLYALAGLTFATFYQTPTLMPFRLAEMGLRDPTRIGLIVSTLPLVAAASALVFGRLRGRLAPPAVLALGFGLFGLAYVGVAWAASPGAAWVWLAFGGIGLGWAMPTLSVWVLAIVPAHRRGQAAGGLTAGVFAGQFVAPLAAQPVVAVAGVQGAFAAAAALLGVAAVALTWWHRVIESARTPEE